MPDYRQYQSGNQSFITSPDFPAEDYGAAPIDPSAPFGSVDSMPQGGMTPMVDNGPGPTPGGPPPPPPPEVPVNAPPQNRVTLDSLPDGGPAPIQTASMTTGPAQPAQSGPMPSVGSPNAGAPAIDPNSLSNIELAQLGYKRVGGRAAQQFIPEHWQNAQRSGAFDPAEQKRLEEESLAGMRDASYQQSAAQLQQNDAEIDAARSRENHIDMMRQDAAAKQRAIQDNVQRDRVEYESLKRDYQQSRRNDAQRGAFGTVPGALSTIFGMLAIGLAAKGKRENLDATISAVQGAVDKQVQAMRAETQLKGQDADNAYARYLKTYNNAEQAEAATKALLNDHAAAQIDTMMAQSRDPLIAAQGAEARAQMQANSNRYLADLDRASEGNTVQAWNLGQQARAASRGGLARMTLEDDMKFGKWSSDQRGQELANQKTYVDTQKSSAETQKLLKEAKPGGDDAKVAKDNAEPLKKVAEIDGAIQQLNKLEAELKAHQAAGKDTGFSPGSGGLTGGNALKRAWNEKVNWDDNAENFQSRVREAVPVIGRGLTGAGYSDSDVKNAKENFTGAGTEEALQEGIRSNRENLEKIRDATMSTMSPEGREFYARQQSAVVPPPNPVQKVR